MLTVIVPVVVLFCLILLPIPMIKNIHIRLGLFLTAIIAMAMGGLSFGEGVQAAIFGVDKLSWVIGLSIFGSIYAQSQVKMGAIDTVLDSFRASIGKTPKGLIASIIITLVIAGSLLGDSVAASTVIGILVIKALDDIGLSPEQTGCVILMGASLGALMPPISQGIFLASSLAAANADAVMQIGYFTTAIIVVICILWGWSFLKVKELPAELIPDRSVGKIFADDWKKLVPLFVLITIVILRSGFHVELLQVLDPIVTPFKKIPILRAIVSFGGVSRVLQAIIVSTLVAFGAKAVRDNTKDVLKEGLRAVSKTVQIQVCAGIMIGAFYKAGLVDTVLVFTKTLSAEMLKLGGGAMMMLVGMLTGSQSTSQNTIFTFLAPILSDNLGVSTTNTALGGAHLAIAGQAMPPAGLCTFVIVGIIGAVLGKAADPVKVMVLALPMTLVSAVIGYAAWFGLF